MDMASLVVITPIMAKEWLKANTHNRRLSSNLVSAYANEMKRGGWTLNHQGIAFDVDGRLIDGQHRLHAIVSAGVPVEMLVFRGLAPQSSRTVDIGKVRSIPDIFKLNNSEMLHVPRASAIANAVICGNHPQLSRTRSKTYIISIMEKYISSICFAMQHLPTHEKCVGSACVSAAVTRAHICKYNESELIAFCAYLKDGVCSHGCDNAPIILRRSLMRLHSLSPIKVRASVFSKTCYALVAFSKKQQLCQVRDMSENAFPIEEDNK